MYHPEQLIKPKKLFTLQPGTLEKLRDAYGDEVSGEISTRGAIPNSIYKELSSLTEKLYRYGHGSAAPNPMQFEYDFRISTVEPGETQRGDDWHADSGDDDSIIVVSSNIPTLFLIPSPRKTQQLEREAILNIHGPTGSSLTRFNDQAIEAAIKKGIFDIYQPKPNEVVMLSGRTVHRSSTNETGEGLSRIFLRTGLHTGI